MSDLPVFIDGPLKGRADMPIDPFIRTHGLKWQSGPEWAGKAGDGWLSTQPEPVHYQFRDVPMFGHTVLIGSVAQPPSSEACFEALVSDQAKHSARHF